MKILIIEDGEKNVESLKAQIREHLGGGHELTIIGTAKDLRPHLPKIREHEYDLVLTDMYIPAGWDPSYGPDLDRDTVTPAGLIATVTALYSQVPVFLCTDANGHKDLLGLLLEAFDDVGYDQPDKERGRCAFSVYTRPNTQGGKMWQLGYLMGKDPNWLEFLKSKNLQLKNV